MALPTPGARQGLLSFRLFGFPVSIHTSFLLIVVALGWAAEIGPFAWAVVVTVSVLAHELGHAFVAAPAGGEPRVDLYMMAGLTTWKPQRASRGRRVAVSVAGPAAGVVLGIALIVLRGFLAPELDSFVDRVLIDAIFVNLGWGLLNLLPMLPLDGGQVVLALMPGDELARVRRTSVVSLVVAGVVAAAAFVLLPGFPFAALLVLFFAFGNVQRLVALRRAQQYETRADPIRRAELAVLHGQPEEALRLVRPHGEMPVAEAEYVARVRAMALLRLGRARDAQSELLDLPPGWVDPVFEATVLLANGQDQLAREMLNDALAGEPQPWAIRELVRVLVERGDEVVAVIGGVTGYGAAGVLDAMYAAGEYAAAAAWGERALGTGATDATVAYNTACAYAKAGDPERALRSLGYAAELGWRDVAMAESDPDLADVRALPVWPDVRARMTGNRV